MMKEKYSSPYLCVEILEKSDILLASSEIINPERQEHENAYRDIMDFFMSGPGGWFD